MTRNFKRAEVEVLLQAGVIQSVEIVSTSEGMCIQFHTKGDKGVLLNERFPHNVKHYSQIDTAARFLRGLGVSKIDLNLSQWPA